MRRLLERALFYLKGCYCVHYLPYNRNVSFYLRYIKRPTKGKTVELAAVKQTKSVPNQEFSYLGEIQTQTATEEFLCK